MPRIAPPSTNPCSVVGQNLGQDRCHPLELHHSGLSNIIAHVTSWEQRHTVGQHLGQDDYWTFQPNSWRTWRSQPFGLSCVSHPWTFQSHKSTAWSSFTTMTACHWTGNIPGVMYICDIMSFFRNKVLNISLKIQIITMTLGVVVFLAVPWQIPH